MEGSVFRHYLHYLISLYLVFGGVFTSDLYFVKIHFYVTFLTLIHWLTNNGQCFLSQMDYNENEEPNGYTVHMLNKIGITNPSKTVKQMCGYGSVLIPCLYSLYKLNANGVRPYLII